MKFLESEGGKTAAVIGMLIYLSAMAAILHLTHHDPQEETKILISNAFTSLMTLLLAKLSSKGGSSNGNPKL